MGDPGGQHRAAGNTLLGLGSLGVALALLAIALRLELRLIDAPALGFTGVALAATGAWLRVLGRGP